MAVVGRTDLFPNKIDQTTSGRAQLEYEHKQVHSGDAWVVTYDAVTGDGATLDRFIVVPNTTRWPHFAWDVAGQAKLTIELYEGSSGPYNAVTAYNRNRNNTRVNTTIIGNPTGAIVLGNLIWTWTSGTTGPGPARSTGATRETGELVLRQNTTYLFRCTSAAANNRISVDLTWYEQTNIEN